MEDEAFPVFGSGFGDVGGRCDRFADLGSRERRIWALRAGKGHDSGQIGPPCSAHRQACLLHGQGAGSGRVSCHRFVVSGLRMARSLR